MDRNILVVARWPLGGIRTYMRYMFSCFPVGFRLTVLAASTQEDNALKDDVKVYSATLRLVVGCRTIDFVRAIYSELSNSKYDVILSQGFVSAVAVYLANFVHRVPHVLTIHGIVEPKYLRGYFGFWKRCFLELVLSNITVIYAVSDDILQHLFQEFPRLRKDGLKQLVLLNGIDLSGYELLSERPFDLRKALNLNATTFLFGYFGRFMPQKGFDLLIDAVDQMRRDNPECNFAVVAVGSGDYILEYQVAIRDKGLEGYFYFLPFQPLVHHLFQQVDTVVIPSRWEACPLLPMEVLCTGVPVIASDCIGLREVTFNTPAFVFASENIVELLSKMCSCLEDCRLEVFRDFRLEAQKRFNVVNSAQELIRFIDKLLGW